MQNLQQTKGIEKEKEAGFHWAISSEKDLSQAIKNSQRAMIYFSRI